MTSEEFNLLKESTHWDHQRDHTVVLAWVAQLKTCTRCITMERMTIKMKEARLMITNQEMKKIKMILTEKLRVSELNLKAIWRRKKKCLLRKSKMRNQRLCKEKSQKEKRDNSLRFPKQQNL